MDGTQVAKSDKVRVFKEVDEKGFGGFLESEDRMALPPRGVGVYVVDTNDFLCDFLDLC